MFEQYSGRIKPSILEGLYHYLVNHVPTGSFLAAVLSNDLFLAVGRADDENVLCLKAICELIHNQFPREAYGSPERVKNWLSTRVAYQE